MDLPEIYNKSCPLNSKGVDWSLGGGGEDYKDEDSLTRSRPILLPLFIKLEHGICELCEIKIIFVNWCGSSFFANLKTQRCGRTINRLDYLDLLINGRAACNIANCTSSLKGILKIGSLLGHKKSLKGGLCFTRLKMKKRLVVPILILSYQNVKL